MPVVTPTTLILGAGASHHLEFPLGSGLVDRISERFNANTMRPLPASFDRDEVLKVVKQLVRGCYPSIDTFLEAEPSMMRVGKFLIASVLKDIEGTDRLFTTSGIRGWYDGLLRAVVNGKSFEGNHLTIVTFNYDRSVEAFLYEVARANFKMSPSEAHQELKKIPIIHLHGTLGPFPESAYEKVEDPEELLAISESISVISEGSTSGFRSDEFDQATAAIAKSERVAFLGFGFHEDNMARLKTDWSRFGSNLFATTAGFGSMQFKQLVSRLEKFGISREMLAPSESWGIDLLFQNRLTLE